MSRKKKRKERVSKSWQRRVADLRNFSRNLGLAIERHEGGDESAYLDMLHNSRTLIGKGGGDQMGLLRAVCRGFGITTTLRNVEADEEVTFDQFLDRSMIAIRGRQISNADFIWEYGSQESAHSDEGLDQEYATAESFFVGGFGKMSHGVTYLISKATHTAAMDVLKFIDANYKTGPGT